MADRHPESPDGGRRSSQRKAEWENLRTYVLAMYENEPEAARGIAEAMGDEAPELPDD